jgi:uncharacterized protein (TIGR02996 family)
MPATARRTASQLFAAIAANPADDTVRLAYADFLEEHDDPDRAEFIRTQVELSRLPAWDKRSKLLRLRERLLLIRHGERWREELPQIAGVTWGRFVRGFVGEATVADARVLAKRADAIRAAAPAGGIVLADLEGLVGRGKGYPWLTSLRLGPACGAVGDAVTRVLNSVLAAHLVHFDCGPATAGDDPARVVAAATHLTRLRELDLSRATLSDGGIAALAQAKHLAGLRVLRLGLPADPHPAANGIHALTASPYLTSLTTLDLANQHLTDEAVRAVLTSPAFARLETVSFAGSALGARAFAVAAGKMRLRDADLSQCVIGDAGLTALAALPQFSGVSRLDLRSCDLGAKGLTALARSPAAASLRELNLADNPLRAHGLDNFAQARWPELHTLNLANCGLGADAVKALSATSGVKRLIDLDLSGNDIGAGGAIAITKAAWANSLVRLNLARCRCAAGAVLAASPRLREVQQLDLTDNPLNPAGVAALMEGDWRELTDLQLSGTFAGDLGVQAITRSAVLPRLVTLSLAVGGLTPAGLELLLGVRGPDGRAVRRDGAPLKLVQLDLSYNPALGDEAVDLLAAAELPALRFLTINHIGLSEAGVDKLLTGPLPKRLVRIESHGNPPPTDAKVLPQVIMRVTYHPHISPDWEATGFPTAPQ